MKVSLDVQIPLGGNMSFSVLISTTLQCGCRILSRSCACSQYPVVVDRELIVPCCKQGTLLGLLGAHGRVVAKRVATGQTKSDFCCNSVVLNGLLLRNLAWKEFPVCHNQGLETPLLKVLFMT